MDDIIRVVKNKLYRVDLPFGHLGVAQSRRKVTKLTQLDGVQFARYQESTGPFLLGRWVDIRIYMIHLDVNLEGKKAADVASIADK
jgi:hypothetical protein